jgi:hypothetical protein
MAEITTNALAGKITVLTAINLTRLNELLGDGKWHAALNLMINAIDADAQAVSRYYTSLASKVNKRHWSPLLDDNQPQSQLSDD